MRIDDIRDHWRDWAVQYGTAERATTLCSSIKRLEIAALKRAIGGVLESRAVANIMEIGCGNGQNIVALAKEFHSRSWSWTGIDYVPEMIEAATENAKQHDLSHRAFFMTGDARHANNWIMLNKYDVVFTDRMLINLSSVDEQIAAIDAMKSQVADGGALVMIENSRQTKDAQNDLREIVGLPRRKDAEFNVFLDDEIIVPHLRTLFQSVDIEDFGSLHDIILYVLLPATLGAEFQYDHPMMGKVADLCSKLPISAGAFGQNRMYVCR